MCVCVCVLKLKRWWWGEGKGGEGKGNFKPFMRWCCAWVSEGKATFMAIMRMPQILIYFPVVLVKLVIVIHGSSLTKTFASG